MKKILVGLLLVVLLISGSFILFMMRESQVADAPLGPIAPQQLTPAQPQNITADIVSVDVEKTDTVDLGYAYPKFSGLRDAQVEAKINADLMQQISVAGEKSKGDAADYCASLPAPTSADDWVCRYGFEEDYKSFTQLGDRILSVRLETYLYSGGAHGNTVVEFINYDLATGEKIDWRSVFAPGADYLGAIANYATADIKKQLLIGEDSMTQADWIEKGSAPTAENYSGNCVGFDQKGLIVVYQQYQVAAYAQGAVEVNIPYSELKSVTDSKWIENN
jgi:hypothetical protein